MDRYRAYLLPGGAALLLLAFYAWRWSSGSAAEPEPAPATPVPTSAAADRAERSPAIDAAIPKVAAHERAAPEPADPEASAKASRDRARRDALREQISQAQRTRAQREAATPTEPDPDALGQLSKEYLQARVRDDFIPLAQECYESALEDDAALEGRLVLSFRIVGEPDVGGIVEEAQLAPDSEIQHPEMVECMRESMMSMSFDPPQSGGAVEVTYPFVFSSEDPS